MYTFSPSTERINYMRELIRDRVIRNDAERMRIITDSYRKNEHMPPLIKRSLAFRDLCEQMTVFIKDFELIVGGKGPHFFSAPVYPEWGAGVPWLLEPVASGEWTIREDGLYHNPDGEELKHTVSPEDVETIRECWEFWKTRTTGVMADAWQPDHHAELRRLNVSSYAEGGMPIVALPAGHLIAGYPKIINTGYGAIRKQAQDWLDEHYGFTMGGSGEVSVLQGYRHYLRRLRDSGKALCPLRRRKGRRL